MKGATLDLDRAAINQRVMGASPAPMNRVWRTIRGYILWSYERGTLHYDVMVTLILLFIFLSPYWINFNDKPVEHNAHQTGVLVVPNGQGGFIYQIEAGAVHSKDDAALRTELLNIIEPIAGEVSISKYEAVRDRAGHILSYKVWVQK
jgi:hypothetical protein